MLSVLEVAILCIFLYQLFAIRAALERTAKGRDTLQAFLRDSRAQTEKMRSETRRDRAEDRQYLQQSREDSIRFREETLRRAEEHVQRMEELLRLEREQVALLQQLAEQRSQTETA